MKEYLDLLKDIRDNGVDRPDRTGTGTRSVFGRQVRFDLRDRFPLLTTKSVHFRSVVHELLWFLSGSTNVKYLQDNGVTIWDEWAGEDGELGPVYGKQWRDFGGVDQIQQMVDTLENDPDSRRNVVSAWNAPEVSSMRLPPCHMFFQAYSRPMNMGELRREYLEPFPQIEHFGEEKLKEYLYATGLPTRYLSIQMYQRSADVFLGVPFNIASYALLTLMLAQVTNHIPYEFIHTFGDLHIYHNHFVQVDTQLARTPKQLPIIQLNPAIDDIFRFKFDDIQLKGYNPEASIKAKVAV